jgi:hypothetical protein
MYQYTETPLNATPMNAKPEFLGGKHPIQI